MVRHDSPRFGRICSMVLALGQVATSAGSAANRAVLSVVTPDTLGLGEEVKIRWDYDDGSGGSLGRFDIALYECDDPFCGQQDCGTFLQEICGKPSHGCLDGSGNYMMTVPSTLTTSSSYKIRVGLHGSTTLYDCTSTFAIVPNIPTPSIEVSAVVSEGNAAGGFIGSNGDADDDASLTVESGVSTQGRRALSSSSSEPEVEEIPETYFSANETVLVQWAFNDGFGGTFARFNIDLYYCAGMECLVNGGCGKIIQTLCEACPDSDGAELVTLPGVYSSHNYKIRVSTWSTVSRRASSCSPKFEIRGRERPEYSTAPPTPLPQVESKSNPYPRPPAMVPLEEDLPSAPEVIPTVFPDWEEDVNIAPAAPDCESVELPEIRYASSTRRMYVEHNGTRGGCVTLTQIWEGVTSDTRPLFPIDIATNDRVENVTGVWLLTEELYVTDGVTLQVHGTADGGDCDELRLLSDASNVINLRAHGGSLSFLGTKVVSWDEDKGTVDTNYEDGRSYISCLSEVIYDPYQTCNGTAKTEMGEARMDIINSEMAYLGFHDSESYGLTWKVRGFCVDKSNLDVFDYVDVYGDVINSNMHDNYFGLYTYGHHGGNWSYNKMHNNVMYGFDPHDDSDYLHIVGNDVWGNGNHGIIASKRCNNVKIVDNHVCDGINAGLFLHRSSDYAIVTGNHVHNNGDAGLAVLETFYMDVNNNVFNRNRYGVRFSVGSGYNWVHDNMIGGSTRYNIFTYLGSDLPDIPDSDGLSDGIVFWRNYLSGAYLESIKLKDAKNVYIVNNRISTAISISFDECSDTTYRDNEEEAYLVPNIKDSACFTTDSELEPYC
ncbi:unnamed protein product [Pylaiella littoralis]